MLRRILVLSWAAVSCVQACGQPPLKQAVHHQHAHLKEAAYTNVTASSAAAAAGTQVSAYSSASASIFSSGTAATYSSFSEYASLTMSSIPSTFSTTSLSSTSTAAAAAPSSSESSSLTLASTSSAMFPASNSTSSAAAATFSSTGFSSSTLASTSSALSPGSTSSISATASSSSSLLAYSSSAPVSSTFSNENSSSAAPSSTTSSSASTTSSSSSSAAAASGGTNPPKALPYNDGISYSASFTQYGAGDTYGSGNCNTNTVACGFFSPKVFQAAASQNLFGVGPGAGAGPACGTCWRLTPQTDSTDKPLVGAQETIVQVNNLCPIAGNPLCSQTSLGETNSLGARVHFDLCIDDGANTHFFGSSGTALGKGTATAVDCNLLAQK